MIFRCEVVEHLSALVYMTAGIFVEFNTIEIAILFPPVPPEMLAYIVECLFQRIGADTEVGVGQHYACCINIAVEPELHTEALGNILHDIVHWPAILGLVGLCWGLQQHSYHHHQAKKQSLHLHLICFRWQRYNNNLKFANFALIITGYNKMRTICVIIS